MRKLPFNFKIEELIPFSRFTLESYTTDRAKFVTFSPDYDGDHLTVCDTTMAQVDKIINPKTITTQMKAATEKLYAAFKESIAFIDNIERYTDMAKDEISVGKNDFGYSKTRTRIHRKDAEGAIKGLQLIQQLAEPHLTILEAKGYTKEKQDTLSKLIKDIGDANALQNKLTNQRAKLVQDNIAEITRFWALIKDILKTGKILFKEDEVKIKEYTQTAILSRLRRQKKADEEDQPKA